MKIPIIWSDKYLGYDFGAMHPFNVRRALPFLELIKEKENVEKFELIEPKPAKRKDLLLVHSEDYIKRLEYLAEKNGFLTLDTTVNQGILDASYYYTGGTIKAFDLALKKGIAFNLLGGLHHASKDHGEGFCIINDHAVAIKYWQKKKKIKNVLVLDIDVHAGNGTQDIFYNDPSVLKVSLHQNPNTIYPGRCFPNEIGEEKGKGYNLNVVLDPGTNGNEYLKVLDKTLEKIKWFKYDICVIVFGADTYKDDKLGNLCLELKDYEKMSALIKQKINKPIVLLAAGGYHKEVHKVWMHFLKSFMK